MSGLYKVFFDESDRIVKVVVSGKATHEDHLAARNEALDCTPAVRQMGLEQSARV